MEQLRERGVYRLPDGQEVIVIRGLQSGYALYSPDAFDNYELPDYEMSASQLLRGGEATGWDARDLNDTGRTHTEREKSFTAA